MLANTAPVKVKSGEKPHKLFDAGGLCLIVNPNGSLWWRVNCHLGGEGREAISAWKYTLKSRSSALGRSEMKPDTFCPLWRAVGFNPSLVPGSL